MIPKGGGEWGIIAKGFGPFLISVAETELGKLVGKEKSRDSPPFAPSARPLKPQ